MGVDSNPTFKSSKFNGAFVPHVLGSTSRMPHGGSYTVLCTQGLLPSPGAHAAPARPLALDSQGQWKGAGLSPSALQTAFSQQYNLSTHPSTSHTHCSLISEESDRLTGQDPLRTENCPVHGVHFKGKVARQPVNWQGPVGRPAPQQRDSLFSIESDSICFFPWSSPNRTWPDSQPVCVGLLCGLGRREG